MEIDWNEVGKEAVGAALSETPAVGTILEIVLGQLWPSSDADIWDDIREQVQAMIDQSISDFLVGQIHDRLTGLKNGIKLYQESVASGDPATAKAQWIDLELAFSEAEPFFQHNDTDNDYRVLLLPEYAQFNNLYLGILRDAVVAGAAWWTAGDLAVRKEDLATQITASGDYATAVYQLGLTTAIDTAPNDPHSCEPFRTVNTWIRFMTFNVSDYVQMWPYYDPDAQLTPPTPCLTREIFSDPYGTADDSGNINLPHTSSPTGPIDHVKVYGGTMINAIEVVYYGDGGPDQQTTTGPMGTPTIDPHQAVPPVGGVDWVGPNSITSVDVLNGDVPMGFTLHTSDGGSMVFRSGGGDNLAYADHIVSSLWVNGESTFYGCADTLVVGFMRADAVPAPPSS